MKGRYATDIEIQDSFQNIKKHSMAGIKALNNFSFESESLEKRTMWASFYVWESLRITVLRKVRESLPGIEESWETSRWWTSLNLARWEETCEIMCKVQPLVILRQQCNNISYNNRIDCSNSQQSIFRGGRALKKEKKPTSVVMKILDIWKFTYLHCGGKMKLGDPRS